MFRFSNSHSADDSKKQLMTASMFLLLRFSKEVLYLLGPTAAIILYKRIASFSVAALILFFCLFVF